MREIWEREFGCGMRKWTEPDLAIYRKFQQEYADRDVLYADRIVHVFAVRTKE